MTSVAHTALGLLGWQTFDKEKNNKTLLLFVLIASLPDIDFAFFLFMGRKAFELHQYYTHNLFFVLGTAILFWPFLKNQVSRWGFLVVAGSHLLLDFFTIDTSIPIGIPLFYPFSQQRFNYSILPNIHKASPAAIFSWHNLSVIGFELIFFWGPLLLIYRKPLTAFFFKKYFQEQ